MEGKKRVTSADFFKGIGIVCMIMAHIGFGDTFNHYVHAFHMPMFFFASGYFFKEKKAGPFFSSKIKTLLMPYLIYTIVIYFLGRLFFRQTTESFLTVLVFMNSSSFIAAALWFLPALFLANVIYWVVRNTIKKQIILSVFIAILALLGNLYRAYFSEYSPFAIDAALVGAGFMHIGYLCRNSKKYTLIE